MALQDLKNAAQAIKDQTKIFGNTHNAVGDLLLQILNIILTSDMITQSSGTDPGKVMSQKSVTSLINALNDVITNINKSVHANNTVQGSENVYLQIISADHNVGKIGVDLYGNAFFEYSDPDQIRTRWHIASKEFLAEVMGKTTITGLNKYIEKFAFNVASAQTLANVGEIMFNAGSGTLELKMTNDVTLQIGQEHLRKVKNDSGVVITNGKLVYVSGGQGANALVKLATTADPDAAQRTFGMATQDITVNGTGYITLLGDVNGLNTSGITEGTELWLGTSGNYTATEPTGATPKIYIGRCLRSHATQGIIGVNIRPIPRMHKLSGVSSVAPSNSGQIYMYNATNQVWELYNLRDIFMATLKNINASDFIQDGALWVSPAVQLAVGSAQVQILTSNQTVLTVARGNTAIGQFSDVAGWQETINSPGDVFNISGGVSGMFIKLKFTVKPTSVSILS